MKTTKIVVVFLFTLINIFACEQVENNHLPQDQLKKEVVSIPHFDFQIASFLEGEIGFIANPVLIKSNWTKVINDNAKLNITITDIKIIHNDDGFFLMGKDTEKQASSIIKLVLDGEILYEHKTLLKGSSAAGSGTTVTCTGCESTGPGSAGECEPQIEEGAGWYCTDCSVGDCVKTTVTTIGGGVAG